MRPLKNCLDYQFYEFCKFFRKGEVIIPGILLKIRPIAGDKASYQPRRLLVLR
jgi:hypothetical protein